MTLSEYLKKNRHSDPPAGTVGVETDWLALDTLEVPSGSLWVGDPYVCSAEDGCVVKVPKGTYSVEAKAMDFAGRKRVSRLRVFRRGATQLTLGKRVGETLTDTGLMAVCDIVALGEAVAGDNDAFNERVVNHNYKDCGTVRFTMSGPVELPYVAPGFGDCDGPVYGLRSGRRRVGIEVEILAPGYAYEDITRVDSDE
jgi:hypothetical protein